MKWIELDWIDLNCAITRIWNKGLVIGVVEGAGGAIVGEFADAFLSEDAHVDLQAEQGKHGEREEREDDDITQILHRLDHSSDDGL